MSRDKFISDNLIHIREHLRQSCANIAQAQGSLQEPSPGNEIHLDLKNPVPHAGGGSSRSSEREYNEFAGRLQHDIAAVGAELLHAQTKVHELDKFNTQLLDIAKRMQEIPVQNSQDFFREFDRLKITYFQIAGRASAFRNTSAPQVQQQVTREPEKKSGRNVFLPISILISGIIISLTLIILFA